MFDYVAVVPPGTGSLTVFTFASGSNPKGIAIDPSMSFYMQEFRIWSAYKQMLEIKKYAYTDLTDYRPGLLVGYWKLKPLLDLR
jgi:streptogramin lyase